MIRLCKLNKTIESLLLISICLCGLFICINGRVTGFFQIASIIFFVLFCITKPQEVKARFLKYRWLLIIYLAYCFFELLPVINSSDLKLGLKIWVRTYVLRGSLFFVVLLSFSNWKQYALILSSLIGSFLLDTLYAIVSTPPPKYGGRLNGFFGHPMIYAGYSCVILPLFFYISLTANNLYKRISYSLITLVCLVTLLLNGTRGAWIACIFSFMVIFFSIKPNLRNIFFLVGIIFTVGTVFYVSTPVISHRMNSVVNISSQLNLERLYIWKSSWEMFKDHPILGVGLGDYGNKYKNKYISLNAKEKHLTRAHSNIFQLLGESGASGLLGYLLISLSIFIYVFKKYKQTKNPCYLICFASALALFIQGLTEYNIAHSSVMKYYWLWTGTLISLGSLEIEKNEAGNFM